MRLKPLEQWICDSCGEIIEDIKDGWLEWVHEMGQRARDFHIVHRADRCFHHTHAHGRSDNHLEYFVGPDGLAYLLAILAPGPRFKPGEKEADVEDVPELIDIIRRLHTPLYEEAQQYWRAAEADGFIEGANEVALYTQGSLKRLISEYGP